MLKSQQEITQHTKKQENMAYSKDEIKPPETSPKEMMICELSDEEFKVSIIKRLNELKESTEGKLNEIRKTRHAQNEKEHQ